MRESKMLMGMPVTVEIADIEARIGSIDEVFSYLTGIEERFSMYKPDSEINQINRGEVSEELYSPQMREVFTLSEETKKLTQGYFDIEYEPSLYDPSGLVKGWAIYHAAQLLKNKGYKSFYVEAGGDVQVYGHNNEDKLWQIGIRHPFQEGKIIKTVAISDAGMATSGTYIRGQHIYNPHKREEPILEIISLTVIGPNVYEADRFATAAFAMGREGIQFIENLPGLEGYMVDKEGMATMTSGFNEYVVN